VVEEVGERPEEMARRLLERGRRRLAVAGDDRSLREVAEVVARSGHEVVVAVIPGPRGCDLLRTFAIPQNPVDALAHLRTDDVYEVDLVWVEGGFGRKIMVNAAYLGGWALAEERRWKRPRPRRTNRPIDSRYLFEVDAGRRRRSVSGSGAVVANGQYACGGLHWAPKAALMDRRFEVQVTSEPVDAEVLAKGLHLRDVLRLTASELLISTAPPAPVAIDGVLVGNTPISMGINSTPLRLKI